MEKTSDEIIKVFMMILLNIQQREENNKGIEVCYRKGIHDFRIQFEKFVSEQEVYFFQKENFSKSMSSLFFNSKMYLFGISCFASYFNEFLYCTPDNY